MKLLQKIILLILFIFLGLLNNIEIALGKSEHFQLACQDIKTSTSDQLQKESLFSWSAPKGNLKTKVNSFVFLKSILNMANNRVKGSLTLIDNIKYCHSNDPQNTNNKDCSELLEWVDKVVVQAIKEARIHLAVAQSPHDLASWLNIGRETVNFDLTLVSEFKLKPWDSLTKEEHVIVENIMNEYRLSIHQEFDEQVAQGNFDWSEWDIFRNENMLSLRLDHYNRYIALMGTLNLLQNIGYSNPNREKIINALNMLEVQLSNEREYLVKIEKKLNEGINYNFVKYEALDLLNYKSLVEEFLINNPDFCNLVTHLIDYKSITDIGFNAIIALPTLAAGFFLPPLGALVLGTTVGAGMALESQFELNNEVTRTSGHINLKDGGLGYLNLSQKMRTRDYDVLIMPIGLGIINNFFAKSPRASAKIIETFLKKGK